MALKELARSTQSIIHAFKRPDFTVTETPLSSFAVRASARSISSSLDMLQQLLLMSAGTPMCSSGKTRQLRTTACPPCTSTARSGGNESLAAPRGREAAPSWHPKLCKVMNPCADEWERPQDQSPFPLPCSQSQSPIPVPRGRAAGQGLTRVLEGAPCPHSLLIFPCPTSSSRHFKLLFKRLWGDYNLYA